MAISNKTMCKADYLTGFCQSGYGRKMLIIKALLFFGGVEMCKVF
jgi:hypothetical protein